MDLVVLSHADVRAVLSVAECIHVMRDALLALARGFSVLPLRTVSWLPQRIGALGTMPAVDASSATLGAKIVTVFPANHGSELDAHQGVVVLFEMERGRPTAIVDASAITAIRTAAVSGVATEALARSDAGNLAILGTGIQARAHLEAMAAVRPLRHVRVFSRTPEHRLAFVRWAAEQLSIEVEPALSAEAAVRNADLVCTTTSAHEPVVRGDWLEPGAHVNAVGSSVPFTRELDGHAMARARLFVDRRESVTNEAGDYLLALREGAIAADHITAELGEVLAESVPGRTHDDEITVFESLGLGVEDVAAAEHARKAALAGGIGQVVKLV